MYYTLIKRMQVKQYKVKRFLAETKKIGIADITLVNTVKDFMGMDEHGQQRYALGAGLYKLRVASSGGKGKSGGARTILAVKKGQRLIWLHLFAKNDKGNVTTGELKKLKMLADILLGLSDVEIDKLVKSGELLEVKDHV